MTDQPTACRTTRHCADHDFCHRCAPALAEASRHLVKAMSAAGIEYPASSDLYAQLAAGIRDAARQAAGQPAAEHPMARALRLGAATIPDEIVAEISEATNSGVPLPWAEYTDRDAEVWHLTDETHDGDRVMLPSAGDMAPMLLRDVQRFFGPLTAAGQPSVCIHPDGYAGECPCTTDCGCCNVAPADPTTADDPTPLRWGLGDVLHGNDDTATVCLSGPDREPYWLELDPERAAVLRDDLAGPEHTCPDGEPCPAHDDPAAEEPQDHPAAELYVLLRKAGEDRDTAQQLIYAHARMAVRQHTALHGTAPVVGQPAEAQPAEHRWHVVRKDGNDWTGWGFTYLDPQRAAEALAERQKRHPEDEFHIVRETTTWTVEEDPR